jgi:hypothetical protein
LESKWGRILLRFGNVGSKPTHPHGIECWILSKAEARRNVAAEVRFVRTLIGVQGGIMSQMKIFDRNFEKILYEI